MIMVISAIHFIRSIELSRSKFFMECQVLMYDTFKVYWLFIYDI